MNITINKIEKRRKYYDFFINNQRFSILKKIINQYELPFNIEKNLNKQIKIKIDEDYFKEILDESQFLDAKEFAINSITRRRKTENEIIYALKNKRFSMNIIDKVIEELKKLDYINDEVYVFDFVEYQKNEKFQSRHSIEKKLFYKIKNKSLINIAIEQIYPENEEIVIASLLLKKKNIQNPEHIKKILTQKGFSYSTINIILQKYTDINQ